MSARPTVAFASTADAAEVFRRRAALSGMPVLDLSVGNPVDPVPRCVLRALREHDPSPGYPSARGGRRVREAAAAWLERRFGVRGLDPDTQVIPISGTKEMVAFLPLALGAGPGSVVLRPPLAYPVYAEGARIAGARCAEYHADRESGDRVVGAQDVNAADVAMVWLNSPGNPTGAVLDEAALRDAIRWAGVYRAVAASDECYLDLVWQGRAVSSLDEAVAGGARSGVLAMHSMSKRSNMAGCRAAFLAGDPELVDRVVRFRTRAGLLVPDVVQAVLTAALEDDEHAERQRDRYLRRRQTLAEALTASGFRIDDSLAGPFLWCSRGEPGRRTAARLADLGIVAVPGDYFGPLGADHVRIALTAADADIDEVARRIVRHPAAARPLDNSYREGRNG